MTWSVKLSPTVCLLITHCTPRQVAALPDHAWVSIFEPGFFEELDSAHAYSVAHRDGTPAHRPHSGEEQSEVGTQIFRVRTFASL